MREVLNKKIYLKISFLLICVLFVCGEIFSQRAFTSSELLNGKINLEGDSLLQNNIRFLKEEKQGMPLVEEMEFRTESDRFELNRQEYLFRMSFNNRKARKIQDRITKNNIHLYELKSIILEESKTIDRYENIVNLYFIQLELEYLENEKIILEDKKVIYQKMIANALVVNVDNLLKVDEDIYEIEREILQHQLQKEEILRQLFPETTISSDAQIDTIDWISMPTMQMVLRNTKDSLINNIAQIVQQAKIDSEQLNYDLENAESKKFLDFVQLKYAGRNEEQKYRELALGIGFTIPTRSSARLELNEATLDVFDEKYKQELLDFELEEDLAKYYAEFDALVKEHQLVQAQISDKQLESLFKKYSKTGSLPPLTLLQLKNRFLKNQWELKKIEKEACLIFLETLRIKGILTQRPGINYLSDKLEYFQE